MTGFITVIAIVGLLLLYLLNVPNPNNKNSINKLKVKNMKVKQMSKLKIFIASSIGYILLLVGLMSLFSVRGDGGYFSDMSVLLFGIVYQIPLSILSSIIYYLSVKRTIGINTKFISLLPMNVPFLWFPLSVVKFFDLYWYKENS